MSTSEMYQKIDAALVLFGKKPVGDKTFPTFEDFFNWLQLKHFTYKEVTKTFKNADKCTNSIPPFSYWPHAALCLTLAERMRTVAGAPVFIKYAYRNPDFNKLVGGEPGSDHLKFALDLVFSTKEGRDIALHVVVEPLYSLNLVELSYGVGTAEPLIHLGVFCGRGQRRWTYRDGRVVGL